MRIDQFDSLIILLQFLLQMQIQQIQANNLPNVSTDQIIQCFGLLHDYKSTAQTRKQADSHLLDLQRNVICLIPALLTIFEEDKNMNIRLQALIYFSNVIKRNWAIRRYQKMHSDMQALKRDVKMKLLSYLCQQEQQFMPILFDTVKFIAKIDFPQAFPDFSVYVSSCLDNLQLEQPYPFIFKQVRDIFMELSERKGHLSHKHFQDCLRDILLKTCNYSNNFLSAIEQGQPNGNINVNVVKLSKYIDQIILAILRMAPMEIIDSQMIPQIMTFLISKLQKLLLFQKQRTDKDGKQLLQKNIKSIIYDLGQLQTSKPMMLSFILQPYYQILVGIISSCDQFSKPACLRYALIGLRKFIREFAYHADDATFNLSVKSKHISTNYLELRQQAKNIYQQSLNEQVIQGILNYFLTNLMSRYSKSQVFYIDFDQTAIDRQQEKELGIEACALNLIQALLQRFQFFTFNLINNLIMGCISNQWQNLDYPTQSNLLSVIALLPKTCKKNEIAQLSNIPILQILAHAHQVKSLRKQFAAVAGGWIDVFSDEQIGGLAQALLNAVQNQQNLDVLLGCCHCLHKIVQTRAGAVSLPAIARKALPIALSIFQNTDNPEVLWPMVSLVSSVIVRSDFDSQILINSVDPSKLQTLVTTQSATLVEALCDMFKGFLCVIPRHRPAPSVYRLICLFLDQHLPIDGPSSQKVMHLWYVALREYSPVQHCDQQYSKLFQSHFRRSMHRKSPTLLYLLEEYMLAGLLDFTVSQLTSFAQDFYASAEQQQDLKIASLSFQITLITKNALQQTFSHRMLELILLDFSKDIVKSSSSPNSQLAVSSTLRNSLLAIINRYIILHRSAFLKFLPQLGTSLDVFFDSYFKSMDHITSRASLKINAIALLSILPQLDQQILFPRLHSLLQLIIPEVELYLSTRNSIGNAQSKIENSPSLRFSSNVLSERKEQARKEGCFDELDLRAFFCEQLNATLNNFSISKMDVLSAFQDQSWANRARKILGQ